MGWYIGVGLILTAVHTPAADPDEAKADKLLEGTWRATSVEQDGEKLDPDKVKTVRCTIRSGSYVFAIDSAKEEGKWSSDAKATPATLDMTVSSPAQFRGRVNRGIYKLDGDKLTLCVAGTAVGGKAPARPTEFDAKKGSGQILYVFERTKSDKSDKP
jgi:uncharacterized protein (TIGR03067 family)